MVERKQARDKALEQILTKDVHILHPGLRFVDLCFARLLVRSFGTSQPQIEKSYTRHDPLLGSPARREVMCLQQKWARMDLRVRAQG
jgi:hypothetical protein